ncbi:hypothetical protein [Chelativorans sp. M5D2P16]|uniref:hypothetical protein n=1 Tax=Chelativorans sp. M5D2P16 TaxID=3095678 RepID=UPI002ACAC8E2|nr:hypothetical protein [Chelativorans sp. M5D2P16]MDZ5696810.1 hypothetical protein [Chelativorans sp. M5D2P16]
MPIRIQNLTAANCGTVIQNESDSPISVDGLKAVDCNVIYNGGPNGDFKNVTAHRVQTPFIIKDVRRHYRLGDHITDAEVLEGLRVLSRIAQMPEERRNSIFRDTKLGKAIAKSSLNIGGALASLTSLAIQLFGSQ